MLINDRFWLIYVDNMDYDKIKKLKVGNSVKINDFDYKVMKIERGIRVSELYNEFLLQDVAGKMFFLKVIPNVSVNLWKLEIDQTLGKPVFDENNKVEIKTVEC
ncbi:MAG: hypothetical protein WC755_03985 [Candidatus Woesearchaeota archaeon]|jgi:hypothetical protein